MSKTEQLTAVFRMFDERGDGEISCCELKKVFRILDPIGWPDSKLDPLLQAFDTRGNGHIGYESFASWIMRDFVPASATEDGGGGVLNLEPVAGESAAQAQQREDNFLLMLQRSLSRGPATVDTPLLQSPTSADANSKAGVLGMALDELPACPETDQDFLLTLQRNISMGPATIDASLLQYPDPDDVNSEAALLGMALDEPSTEPPTRRGSFGPDDEQCPIECQEEFPLENPQQDQEFLLTLQRSISGGPATVDTPLLCTPSCDGQASKTHVLQAALDAESPIEPPGWHPSVDSSENQDLTQSTEVEADLMLKLQRCVSLGPTALDVHVPEESASANPASKVEVFHEVIDPPTEPPTREPSLEPLREETSGFMDN